jgi:hypothetical protein
MQGRKQKMKYDTKKIVTVIQDAIKAADAADPGPGLDNDGGTCNFDAAYLQVPGMRKAQAAEIAAALPSNCITLNDYPWQGRILMLRHSNGQAMRRTLMAEASGRVFKASGMAYGMYYQAD